MNAYYLVVQMWCIMQTKKIRNILYISFLRILLSDPVGIAYPRRLAPAILQNLKRLQRVKSKLFSLKPFNLS